MPSGNHQWFIELYVLDSSIQDEVVLLYGFAQPTDRDPRPWHGEPVSACAGLIVLRSNLSASDYQQFEQQLQNVGRLQIDIAKPKARSIRLVNVGLVQRPPVVLRGPRMGMDGYERSPADGPASCVEFWNLEKDALLTAISFPAQTRLDRYARLREVAGAVARETGAPLDGDAARRLGNFDRIEPARQSETDEVIGWSTEKERPDLAEGNGIKISLGCSLRSSAAPLIIVIEIRNGDIATLNHVRRWMPGDPPEFTVFTNEPVSSAHLKVYDEAAGNLVAENADGAVIRAIGFRGGMVGGTAIIRDEWARRLEQKGPGQVTQTQVAPAHVVQRIAHVVPSLTTQMGVTDPWVTAGFDTKRALQRVLEPQEGLFLRRDSAVQEAEAFTRIRDLFDKPEVKAVTYIDPYFNAEGMKLLLRLRNPISLRILSSLKADSWASFREQLRQAEPFVHPNLAIHQANNRPGDQQFHDRYLIVDAEEERRVYDLSNSFAALGAKHPIVVAPLRGLVALEVEEYVSELLANAGPAWWPEPKVAPIPNPPETRLEHSDRKAMGAALLAGILGNASAAPSAANATPPEELWSRLAPFLARNSTETLPVRVVLDFVASGLTSGVGYWSGAADRIRAENLTACADTLVRCIEAEIDTIGPKEDLPRIHRTRYRPLLELTRRWSRNPADQLPHAEDLMSLRNSLGPPYDRRYGVRLALYLLLQLQPERARDLIDSHFLAAQKREAERAANAVETDIADEPAYLRAASLLWYLIDLYDENAIAVLESSKTLLLRQLFAASRFVAVPGAPRLTESIARISAAPWPSEERIGVLLAVANLRRGTAGDAGPVCIEAAASLLSSPMSTELERLLFREASDLETLSTLADRAPQDCANKIRSHIVSSFEKNLIVPKDGSSVHFSESELVSMRLAVKALSERPVAERIAHAGGVLKRLRNTVARLEHPRILTTLAVEFRIRMAVSTLAACYLLHLIEGIVASDPAKAHAMLSETKSLLDRAFRKLFGIYVLHAYSPVPDVLRTVWERLALVAPTVIEAVL